MSDVMFPGEPVHKECDHLKACSHCKAAFDAEIAIQVAISQTCLDYYRGCIEPFRNDDYKPGFVIESEMILARAGR